MYLNQPRTALACCSEFENLFSYEEDTLIINRSVKSLSVFVVMALSLTFIPASFAAASPVSVVTKAWTALFNGPDADFNAPSGLPYQSTAPALARTPDNVWIQVSYQGRIGWVQAGQVTITGNLGSIPALAPVKAGDAASVLSHFCTHPVAIPAAPIWGAGGTFAYHPNVDTVQLRDAATDELSDWNWYNPFYSVYSDLPTVVVCVTDKGILPGQSCPYIDTSTGKPFSVQYTPYWVDVKVISVHSGQVVQIERYSGQNDELPDYQQISTTVMTNQTWKDVAVRTGIKFCPDHANPQILTMGSAPVTPDQVYSLFAIHQQACTAGSPGCPAATTPNKSN